MGETSGRCILSRPAAQPLILILQRADLIDQIQHYGDPRQIDAECLAEAIDSAQPHDYRWLKHETIFALARVDQPELDVSLDHVRMHVRTACQPVLSQEVTRFQNNDQVTDSSVHKRSPIVRGD